MEELTMVVDLARKVGVIFIRRLQYDLYQRIAIRVSIKFPTRRKVSTNLGSIGKLMRGKIDLAKRAFSDETAEMIISHAPQILGGEFAAQIVVSLRCVFIRSKSIYIL